MHRIGINCRHLGILYCSFSSQQWKNKCLFEMIFRIAKVTLRILIRTTMEHLGIPSEDPYIRVVVDYLNLLLGESTASISYWKQEITQSLKNTFFYQMLENSTAILSNINLNIIDKKNLMKEILESTGISLTKQYTDFHLDQEQPFSEEDINHIVPVAKPMAILKISNAFMMYSKKQTQTTLQG
jgi:hypothetical protein